MLWPLILSVALAQSPTAPGKAQFDGQIVNSVTGDAVRKARVILQITRTREQKQQPDPVITITDAAGKFQFLDLDPGSYRLTAHRDGFAETSMGDPIVLGREEHKIGFTLKMVPHGIVTGRVLDEDGDPIRNVVVSAMSHRYTRHGRDLQSNGAATTDDLGNYRLIDLPPGKYFIKVSQGNSLRARKSTETNTYQSVLYPAALEPSGANQIEITPGKQVSGIDFMLHKARYATVRGRVIAPTDARGVSVGIMTVNDGGSSSSSSSVDDKDGTFAMVVAPGSIYITGSFVINGQRHTAQVPVHVLRDDIDGIEIRPLPPADLPCRIAINGPSKTKPSELSPVLEGPGNRYDSESVVGSEDRRFFRSVGTNRYRIFFDRLSDLYLKSVQWGDADITDTDLDLSNGIPPRTELNITLGVDGGQIEGVVKNEKDEPVPSAVVTLVPTGRRSATFYKYITANELGSFTIRSIAPGDYKIYAWDKVNYNAVIYDPSFLPPHDSAAQRLAVSVNDKKNVTLKLIINPEQQP